MTELAKDYTPVQCPRCGSDMAEHILDFIDQCSNGCNLPQWMEDKEDDWDEVAYNGWGTGHRARMGRVFYGADNGVFVLDVHRNEDDAIRAIREWAEHFTDGLVINHADLKDGE